MQDMPPSSREPTSRTARTQETDYSTRPKTPATGEMRRTVSQRTFFRRDLTASLREARSSAKSNKSSAFAADRSGWWRVALRDTPNPGAYQTHLNTFVNEAMARPMTYGFKNDGRRRDPQPLEPRGKDLLPGAYAFEDFAELTNRLRLTYGFKGPQREEILRRSMSAHRDKDIDVPPGSYETQNYQMIDAPPEPVRHSSFKSKIERKVFDPKLGPAPGDYETQMTTINLTSPTITSPFRSNIDRFVSRPTNVPGPGTYEKLTFFPTMKRIDHFSARGVYFNANFHHDSSTHW